MGLRYKNQLLNQVKSQHSKILPKILLGKMKASRSIFWNGWMDQLKKLKILDHLNRLELLKFLPARNQVGFRFWTFQVRTE